MLGLGSLSALRSSKDVKIRRSYSIFKLAISPAFCCRNIAMYTQICGTVGANGQPQTHLLFQRRRNQEVEGAKAGLTMGDWAEQSLFPNLPSFTDDDLTYSSPWNLVKLILHNA